MEILPADSSATVPSFVQCRDNIFRERAFLKIFHVLLDMLRRRSANDDRIPVFALELAVVGHPTERALGLRQAMLFSHRSEDVQSVEVLIIPVSRSVHLACRTLA